MVWCILKFVWMCLVIKGDDVFCNVLSVLFLISMVSVVVELYFDS